MASQRKYSASAKQASSLACWNTAKSEVVGTISITYHPASPPPKNPSHDKDSTGGEVVLT